MKDVAGEGRTVLFVSHSLPAVKGLCPRAVLLNEGRMIAAGQTDEVIDLYLKRSEQKSAASLSARADRQGDGSLRIVDVKYLNDRHVERSEFAAGEDLTVALKFEAAGESPLDNVSVAIAINNDREQQLSVVGNEYSGEPFRGVEGTGWFVCRLPRAAAGRGRLHAEHLLPRERRHRGLGDEHLAVLDRSGRLPRQRKMRRPVAGLVSNGLQMGVPG